jgi:molybdate transport system substrate-binding protein
MAPTDISVLSAGAVGPALKKISEEFQNQTSRRVHLTFATAPTVLERVGGGTPVDIVIAPPPVLDDLLRSGQISTARRVLLGRIGVGVMVRAGAPQPPISTVDQLKKSLLEAASVVFNRASTGIYLAELFQRLEMAPEIEPKTIRYPDFAAVLDHIKHAGDREIGFGASTVIAENGQSGVTFVGALPAEVQNYTAYEAALVRNGGASAADYFSYLESPQAKSVLVAAGID